jgi:hypothetical protein
VVWEIVAYLCVGGLFNELARHRKSSLSKLAQALLILTWPIVLVQVLITLAQGKTK